MDLNEFLGFPDTAVSSETSVNSEDIVILVIMPLQGCRKFKNSALIYNMSAR